MICKLSSQIITVFFLLTFSFWSWLCLVIFFSFWMFYNEKLTLSSQSWVEMGFGCSACKIQLCAWLPSLLTGVRLRVTMLCYKPCCFPNVNCPVIILTRYWSLSQQAHFQPHSKSKALQLSTRLWSGPLSAMPKTIRRTNYDWFGNRSQVVTQYLSHKIRQRRTASTFCFNF